MSTVLDGTFSFAEQRDEKTTHAVNNSLVAQNSCNTVHGQKVAKHKKCETMSIVKDISDYFAVQTICRNVYKRCFMFILKMPLLIYFLLYWVIIDFHGLV